MIRTIALALLVAACGGKQSAPATTAGGSNAAAEQHEAEATMPPAMAKFHDVLAPRWHAAPGPERMKDTCGALSEFHAQADALAKATPPTTANADTWTTGTRALVDAVANLDATCKANDTTQFEAAFTKVHESFHGLMGAAGMHPEGEEHKM
jgi:hypothetical protein